MLTVVLLEPARLHRPGTSLALFVTTAVVLLGSPGPGIAALVAVGRARGLGGLRFYLGLQVGLAGAFGVSAAGLAAALATAPAAATALGVAGTAYLG
ncbi:hypothetical protein tb265_11440 [Gemmatimonadetes bacterium T265]|nr:hypothetical protein tb265_11440 [Gemmatimonadetes bacterium T265]